MTRLRICDNTGVDAWEGELWVQPELTDDGVLINPIRECKASRTLNVAFTCTHGTPLGRAVDRAFSYRLNIPGAVYLGGPHIESRYGYFAGSPKGDKSYQYIDYYRDTETITDVAVFRSYPSTAYNSGSTWKSAIAFEQTLIQAKIPFDLIFEEQLKDLSKYKVLALPNTESMPDCQLEWIREYVRNGGGLAATGSASLYNEWRRSRPNFGLGDVLGLTSEDANQTRRAYRTADAVFTWVGAKGLKTVKNEFGKGRAVYIPRVIPSYEGSTIRMDLPENWEELVEAVRWAAHDDLSVDIQAPLTVVMNLYEKPAKNQIILHLVNFNRIQSMISRFV